MHTIISPKAAMISIVKSSLFIGDVCTDILYQNNPSLQHVRINDVPYNFKMYLMTSLIAPMAFELITCLRRNYANGFGIKYAMTEFVAMFLN